jgi:hypothetical protein
MSTNSNTNTEAKRNAAIEAEVNTDAGTLVLTFANGERLELNAANLHSSVRQQALFHGLKQKLVDAAAISRNPETGRSATVADKYAAVKAVYDRLLIGQWNAPRGEGASGAGGLLFRALCVMFEGKKEPHEVRAWLDGKTDAEQAALRKNDKVAAIIARIRPQAKPDAAIDTDALLNEISDAE